MRMNLNLIGRKVHPARVPFSVARRLERQRQDPCAVCPEPLKGSDGSPPDGSQKKLAKG